MMFNALSSLHLITVINKHGGTSSYKVNWDKSGLLSKCKYCVSAVYSSRYVEKVSVFYIAFALSLQTSPSKCNRKPFFCIHCIVLGQGFALFKIGLLIP